MKKITNDLLYKYSFLSGITSNHSGTRAFFTRKTANKEKNNYNSNLYLYEKENILKLTSCNSVKSAFWLDDENIVFVSNRDKEEKTNSKTENIDDNAKKAKQINKLDEGKNKDANDIVKLYKKSVISHTEAEPFLELKGKVSNIDVLSNNKLIYLKNRDIMSTDSEYFAGQEKAEGYMRIRRIPFYMNGGSFSFQRKTSLYVYDMKKQEEKEINFKDYTVEAYELNKKRDKAVIMASKIQKRGESYTALFEYNAKTGKAKKILDDSEYSIKDPYAIYVATYWGDKIVFLGSTMEKHGLNENRLAYIIENGKVKLLCGEDIDYLNSGVQDMVLGGGRSYHTRHGKFDFTTTNSTINKIARMSSSGKVKNIFSFDGSIGCFDYVDKKILFVGLNAEGGQEIYLEDQKISDFHSFLTEYYVAEPKPLSVKSAGVTVDGFVLLPEGYDKKKSVPAVLEIHGGPKTAYQNTYFHEMQMLVSEGYVVMFCNPRGSAGKGNEFFDIFGEYGEVDYENIMSFTEKVLKKYDKIDKKRLFVTGGSYGGYMTNHIVGMTNMFRAAVTQRCISNWTSMYGTSDIGYYFTPDQHRTSIEKETFWQDLWDVSPLKNIDNVQTPTLIIHSDKDYRCPLEQGYQFFTALIDRGIDSELLVFEDEHHGLSREGKPNNRIVRLDAIKDWFKKYDKK